jgi:hypothetical protein
MHKKIALVLIVLVFAAISVAQAQYYDATHRQTEQQRQLFKKEKVRMVTLSVTEAGAEVPFSITHYDTAGRVQMLANPKHHEHFRYDDKGRMAYWLDSANDGRRFEKFEHNFGYDANNRVNSYNSSKSNSTFSTAQNGDIIEEVSKNGIVAEKRSYAYNQDGKPVLEMFKDTGGRQLYMHKVLYNKYGDVASEIIVNNLKNCKGDSMVIINAYDSKGRIIQKQKFLTNYSCDNRLPNAQVDKKFISETIQYFYDSRGRLVNENQNSNDPAHINKKEYQYYDDGMVMKEMNVDGNGKSSGNLVYRYYYYIRKK